MQSLRMFSTCRCYRPLVVLTRCLASIFLFVATPCYADSINDLLEQKACLSCHDIDVELNAPSFREIARRYAGDGQAGAYLAGVIRHGSGDIVWGGESMPANSHLTDAEVRQLVDWILSL